MSKFVCDATVPPEIRTAVNNYFVPLEWMVPAWCQRVAVSWDRDSADGCSAHITVHFEYRAAELTLTSLFLEIDEPMRRDTALHELIHLHVNPLFNYADRTIGALLKDDEGQKERALEELRRYIEGVTQDLTDTVFGRIYAATQGETKGRQKSAAKGRR